MQTTLVNLVIEWEKAPASFRLEFDHATVLSGGINVGWGTHDAATHSFTFTSTDEACRVCFGLESEGTETSGIQAVIRAVDTDQPFEVMVAGALDGQEGELELRDPPVKVYAEVDWFAML